MNICVYSDGVEQGVSKHFIELNDLRYLLSATKSGTDTMLYTLAK